MTFNDYLKTKEFTTNTIKGHERELYHLEQWADEHEFELDNMKHEQLIEFVQELQRRVKPQTIKNRLRSYKHYFQYLKSIGTIDYDPTAGIEIKNQETKASQHLTKERLDEIYSTFEGALHHKVMLGLIIYQATDAGALRNLKPENINLDKSEIFLSGTRRSNSRKLSLQGSQLMPLYKYTTDSKRRYKLLFSVDDQLQALTKQLQHSLERLKT